MTRLTQPNCLVPKNKLRKTKATSRRGATIVFCVVVLAGLAIAGWKIREKRSTSRLLISTETNALGGAVPTHVDDRRLFITEVSKQTNVAELVNFGTRLMTEGRAEQAIVCFRRVLELKPEDEEACFNLGAIHARIGQNSEADRYYRESLRLLSKGTDTVQLLNFGTRFLDERRISESIACYRRALELKPEDEEACFNLGVAYARAGQLNEAEHYYREAIKLFPEYVEAHNNLGNLFTRQKRYADAAEEFNIALKFAPENASAHNNLGRTLAEQGNAVEALKHFTESARLDTNYVEARFNMGAAYLVLGQTNDAAAAFRDALRLRPDFAPAAQALTRIKDVLR